MPSAASEGRGFRRLMVEEPRDVTDDVADQVSETVAAQGEQAGAAAQVRRGGFARLAANGTEGSGAGADDGLAAAGRAGEAGDGQRLESTERRRSRTPSNLEDGEVIRVIKRNIDSGWLLFEGRNRDGQVKTITAFLKKGDDQPVGAGDRYQAANLKENDDPKWGRRWKAADISILPPIGVEGVVKWLSRGSNGGVPGTGPATAEKLFAYFGDRLPEALKDPVELVRAGIGERQARAIVESYTRNLDNPLQNVRMFLSGLGLGARTIDKIVERYGAKSRHQVESDPWALAFEIQGIGFLKADDIGKRMKIDPSHEGRITAGIKHALYEAETEGHCGLPAHQLIVNATKILDLDGQSVKTRMIDLVKSGRLAYSGEVEPKLVRTHASLEMEKEIAQRLIAGMFEAEGALDDRAQYVDAIGKGLRKVLTEAIADGFIPDESQTEALRTILNSRVSVLTGGPGRGKTTILNLVIKALAETGRTMVLPISPTANAAKRMTQSIGLPAFTAHRGLAWTPYTQADSDRSAAVPSSLGDADDDLSRSGGFTYNQNNPLDVDVVVIDEASLYAAKLFLSTLRAIDFRRTRLIIVGDHKQIPSVGAGRILADLIDSRTVPIAHLTKIHRQKKGSGIPIAVEAIDEGKVPGRQIGRIEDSTGFEFNFIEINDPEQIHDAVVDLVSRDLPQLGYDPMQDIQVLSPGYANKIGVDQMNISLKEILNPINLNAVHSYICDDKREGLTFSRQDKVIHVENWKYHSEVQKLLSGIREKLNQSRRLTADEQVAYEMLDGFEIEQDRIVANGEVGLITRVFTSPNGMGQEVAYGLEVDYGDSGLVRYRKKDLSMLEQANAISLHKSQGAEYPVCIIPLHTCHYPLLQRTILRTGISRGKQRCYVVGSMRALKIAVSRIDADLRCTQLPARLRQNHEQLKASLQQAGRLADIPQIPPMSQIMAGVKAPPGHLPMPANTDDLDAAIGGLQLSMAR